MGKLSGLFSILFFFACTLSCFLGIYIIFINPKARINRIFFALSISLSIWAYGFAIAISAPVLHSSIVWRRFSALGWGSFFSIILHFFLILTRKKNLLKKWWVYLLIYLPAAVTIYVFAISNTMSVKQLNLVNTPLGWINIAKNNGWDWFYNIYYSSFTITGIVMVWNWGRKSASYHVKKQASLMSYSFMGALLVGTVTDIIGNSFLSINIPQLAPMIICFPLFFINYSIKQYGLMKPIHVDMDEFILNDATRAKMYYYLSIAFIAGGILNFISQYLFFNDADFKSVLFTNVLILSIGFIIQIIEQAKLKEDIKDIFVIATIASVIPVVTLKFVSYASITVWAFPFIFIIISLAFSKRIVLVVISICIILTQILVWVMAPNAIVKVDASDHIGRIGLFAIAIGLAFYVHKIYILRLKENADQIKFQKLISDITSDFVTVNQMNLDDKINHMLRLSGQFFQVDRTYAFLLNPDANTMTYNHEWCNEGIEPEIETIGETPTEAFPWFRNQISKGVLYIPDIEKLPEEAWIEKQKLRKRHVQSEILIPIIGKGLVFGFLGLDSVKSNKKWRNDHINLLKIITNLLADALTKVDAEKEINFLAYYDPLTKLPNRLLFKDRVSQAIYLANRTEKMVGVIFLDLDSFKIINDTLGHEGGDELLIEVAQKLSQCVRKSDTVSRFGGDEFLVMLNNISTLKDMVKVTTGIMDRFNQPYIINGQEFFVTASAGIAVYPLDGEDTETLIKNADIAMYHAKEKGKNQYALCSSDMKDKIKKKMTLTNNLYRSLERNELQIYYQPQVRLNTGKIIALEALLRWNHPEFGVVSPGAFIPLAEQTGLINPIGEWVLRTACRQNKMWQEMGFSDLRVAVNVSVNQFRSPNLIGLIGNVLAETDLSPEYLELEITENIAIKEANNIIDILNNLKKLGVSISIDDFGTGYSSLSRLKMLPIDRIKLDIQFVKGIEGNDKDKAIAKVILNLAQNLDLKVIAEGVETEQQLQFLNQWKCDEAQGFLFYRPMPVKDIETLFNKQDMNRGVGFNK